VALATLGETNLSMNYFVDVEKTQAAGTHISNAQVDNYLKVEFDVAAENTLIDTLTKSAEEQAEEICNICINTKDVTLRITDAIREELSYLSFNLPYRGTISSLVVKTVDEGTETTLASTQYYVQGRNTLIIKDLNTVAGSWIITYTVAPSNLPIGLDAGIFKLIGDYYVNRTNDSIVPISRISESTRAILSPFEDTKAWL